MSSTNGDDSKDLAPSISVKYLSYSFPDGSSGLKDVVLALPPGSRTLLVGGIHHPFPTPHLIPKRKITRDLNLFLTDNLHLKRMEPERRRSSDFYQESALHLQTPSASQA